MFSLLFTYIITNMSYHILALFQVGRLVILVPTSCHFGAYWIKELYCGVQYSTTFYLEDTIFDLKMYSLLTFRTVYLWFFYGSVRYSTILDSMSHVSHASPPHLKFFASSATTSQCVSSKYMSWSISTVREGLWWVVMSCKNRSCMLLTTKARLIAEEATKPSK